jgi:hypothetical protein
MNLKKKKKKIKFTISIELPQKIHRKINHDKIIIYFLKDFFFNKLSLENEKKTYQFMIESLIIF